MEHLDAGVDGGGQGAVGMEPGWKEKIFLLLCSVLGGLGAYYLVAIRFPAFHVRPGYTVVPDPYLPLAAFLLLVIFVSRHRSLFLRHLKDGWMKGVTVLWSESVIALSVAALVREVGYRVPGLKLPVDWMEYSSLRLKEIMRVTDGVCQPTDQDCWDRLKFMLDIHMASFDASVSQMMMKFYWLRYSIIEGVALMAMIAVFLGLHRLVMSGRLGQARSSYLRMIDRYGVGS